ncbi:MAG: acyltransferase [Gammaproteobacteria bacterium]|nr:acyltransferase [Gammaproteobacteria bacterium]
MFGTLRLLLAALVAMAHTGWLPFELNPGVVAVVGFYLLAGFVMHAQLSRHYPPSLHGAGWFYLERLLRIFPQYLFFLVLTVAFFYLLNPQVSYLSASPGPGDWLANLLVLPLNFYMFTGQLAFILIPPAWSLGAELQFYLLAPLLLFFRQRWLLPGAVLLSALVFTLALGGLLNPDHYGYRLLPGILFIFIAGIAVSARRWRLLGAILLLSLLAAGVSYATGQWREGFIIEVLLGLWLGLALIVPLARLRPRGWDTRLGYLAYGVFLSHFLVIWLLQSLTTLESGTLTHFAAVLGGTLLLASLGHLLVESRLITLRRRIRQRAGNTPPGPP